MFLRQLRHWVLLINILIHLGVVASRGFARLLLLNREADALFDRELDSALGDEAQIGTRKAVGLASDVRKIDIWADWSLAQLSLQNRLTAWLIWKRHVHQRIQTAGTAECVVELLGTIRGTNDEDVLLGSHTIHFWCMLAIEKSTNKMLGALETYQ